MYYAYPEVLNPSGWYPALCHCQAGRVFARKDFICTLVWLMVSLICLHDLSVVLQGPIISHPPQRQGTSNARSSSASATNNNMPNRPRPQRRVGGSNVGPGPAQSSLSNPPTPPPAPPFPVYQLPPVNYRNMGPIIPDSSPRDHHRNNNWDARPLVGSTSRRGNFGSHPRGDGSYHHNNYSNRRDHDRGNFVNTRDAHAPQPRMPPRGILRHPPPNTAAFLGPQPIGPFPNPVPYPG
jgi:la-related protein 1